MPSQLIDGLIMSLPSSRATSFSDAQWRLPYPHSGTMVRNEQGGSRVTQRGLEAIRLDV